MHVMYVILNGKATMAYMSRSATIEEIVIIYEYIRKLMPDLSIKLDRVSIDSKLYDGIFVSTKIDKEAYTILIGLLYTKAAILGLIDNDGSLNVNMAIIKSNKSKNIVLYFT